MLANAEKAIEAFGEGFPDWIQDDIDAMGAARLRLSQGEGAERTLADL